MTTRPISADSATLPDERWDNTALQALRRIKGSDFEAVDASSLMVAANSGQARTG